MCQKLLGLPLLAGLLVAAVPLAWAPPASASPGETFTLHADKMSFRCMSTFGELLLGKLKTEDVVIDNLTIYDGYTTFSPYAEIPKAEMEVTTVQVVVLAVTHIVDLTRLLFGQTVEWENVTIKVKRMEASSMEYVFLEVWA